ncbi:MAG: purine-nucleoside phosphorylase [Nitrospirae bacterium]|nr:purine-nucleoside phosphorylase [Nitrospirota bacterium]
MTNGIPSGSLIEQAVAYLKSRLPARPTVGLILGSGLGGFADRPPTLATIPYADIPGFPTCSVQGHAGRLVLTDRCGPCVAILQGRVHRYEGLPLETVTRSVRVLAALGVETLIVTCTAGSLDTAEPGDLMVIEDHLNLMGDNPLVGVGRAGTGSSGFVEMANAYDPVLWKLAERVAGEASLRLHRGVLASVLGPTYETAAEAAMLRALGAHAVSMSTVPEVIVARALNLQVLGLALITNRAGVPQEPGVPHQQVIATAESRATAVGAVLEGVLRQLETAAREASRLA